MYLLLLFYSISCSAHNSIHITWHIPTATLCPINWDSDKKTHQLLCQSTQKKLLILVKKQRMYLVDKDNKLLKDYPICTAKKGTGETPRSNKTPRGWFVIKEKVGDRKRHNQNFSARKPCQRATGITTRILTLEGIQTHNTNTRSRCIYIHGTPFTGAIGIQPRSEGCIRMHANDIIQLYSQVSTNTAVYIYDGHNPLAWQPHTS